MIDTAIVRGFGLNDRRGGCKGCRSEGGIDRGDFLQAGLDREAAEDFAEESERVRELFKVAAVRRGVNVILGGPDPEGLFAQFALDVRVESKAEEGEGEGVCGRLVASQQEHLRVKA